MGYLFLTLLINTYIQSPGLDAEGWPFYEEEKCQVIEPFRYPGTEKSDSSHSFDVLYYKLNLYFPMTSKYLGGCCHIDIRSMVNGFDTLELDLIGLTVDSVKVNKLSASYTQFPDTLHLKIDLDQIFNLNDSFEVDIYYQGVPKSAYRYNATYPGMPDTTGFTFTEPSGSKYWFPCFDEPWDKANGCEINVTVPKGFVASSNGLLMEVDTVGNLVTYYWKETHPITTYLMSIAITKFATYSDWYHPATEDSIEIKYYMYRTDSVQAHTAFANVVEMMDFFSTYFCEYPFSKYGMSGVHPFGGGMEHQTITTISRIWITSNEESGIAHELAHMWWGDMITCLDWRNIWINEGFATYSEALWTEYKYGEQTFKDEMNSYAGWVFRQDSSDRFPIYNPSSSQLFNYGTIYCKGAWVLHMLRYVVGDSIFWNILPDYAGTFKYGNATVDDFKDRCEVVSEMELDWFFDEWIYDQGYPEYTTSWYYNQVGTDSFRVFVTIAQNQSNAPIFKMPVELTIETSSGTIVQTVWDSLASQDFDFVVIGVPSNLIFDKDFHILTTSRNVGVEESSKIKSQNAKLEISENPCNRKVIIRLSDSKIKNSKIRIYNISGKLVKNLLIPRSPSGKTISITWDAKDCATGVYFVKLYAGGYCKDTKKLVLVR